MAFDPPKVADQVRLLARTFRLALRVCWLHLDLLNRQTRFDSLAEHFSICRRGRSEGTGFVNQRMQVRILPSALGEEIPISKHQCPMKSQGPNPKCQRSARRLGSWTLFIHWTVRFGSWIFRPGPASVADARQPSKLSDVVRLLGGALRIEN